MADLSGVAGRAVYQGTGVPHDGIDRLPPPPPWRSFDGGPLMELDRYHGGEADNPVRAFQRATSYRAAPEAVRLVNAALYLRRPLLVTGRPGVGKSTLAFSIAQELKLGPVLNWPITSRSTLHDGLYSYDALGRLHEANLSQVSGRQEQVPDIGRYVRLGPLGTALLPWSRPRVLLVDELDKSDIDLPNDLLIVLEEGGFVVPELERLPDDQEEVNVMAADGGRRAPVRRGRIRCNAFPMVVITSNGEREFPPAFLRRCIRLQLPPPDERQLAAIVEAHLGPEVMHSAGPIIREFLTRRKQGDLATDQLLNAIYLTGPGRPADEDGMADLIDSLLRTLDG